MAKPNCDDNHLNLEEMQVEFNEIDHGQFVMKTVIDDDLCAVFKGISTTKDLVGIVGLDDEPILHSSYDFGEDYVKIQDLNLGVSNVFGIICYRKGKRFTFKLLPGNEYSEYGDD